MAQSVIFRGKLLTVFVERCPRCYQPVFDLFSFLLLERDFLSKISRTVSFCQNFDFDVVDRHLLSFHFVLVAEYFRLVWADSQTHCFRAGLEFT